MCLLGAARAGAELLAALPRPDLRAFYAWVPMLPPDTESAAQAAAQRFAEPRASHYWDGGRHLSAAVGAALGIDNAPAGRLAWDVYLAYPRGEIALGRPDFWMHQLNEHDAPRLDAAVFRQRIEMLLDAS